MTELPAVDAAKCTGCGDCVAVCPTDCLAMAGPLPWLPRPADCIACSACVLVCPTDAVRLVCPPDISFGDDPGGGG
jgi:formate hydrogenlyase subunit 6/NADH:ubiquinone oxidoreductase subunit I